MPDGVGGESWLERETLRLLRAARIAPPKTQVVFRRDRRTLARVDLFWPDANLVVEVAGHGTHASRIQRQRDAQRITELTLLGLRVFTFTYEDIVGRPDWVLDTVREALGSFMSPNLPVAC